MQSIRTNRLILRPLCHEDFAELCTLQADVAVMKYIGHGVRKADEVKATLDLCIAHQQQFGFGLYAVLHKETEEFIGRAGIIHLGLDPNAQEVEIAFAFKVAYWNQGYGYETAEILMDNWFNNPDHQQLIAVARMENKPCIKLLDKLGMKFSHFATYKDISNVGYFSIDRQSYLDKKF
ncbi:GNAT family N-acetyltransferase [Legionella sp.]|uniref:GNAT family N-acetyltransferase n=1 Tax=Legionella sp. TaxID=459 RepID=UPI00321FBBA5